jgi:hypothetical protein
LDLAPPPKVLGAATTDEKQGFVIKKHIENRNSERFDNSRKTAETHPCYTSFP